MPITDLVGARTYSPTEEACRRAPAFLCAMASRLQRLRKKLDTLDPDARISTPAIRQLLHEFTEPMPFEAELLSGSCEQVNLALESFGEYICPHCGLRSHDEPPEGPPDF